MVAVAALIPAELRGKDGGTDPRVGTPSTGSGATTSTRTIVSAVVWILVLGLVAWLANYVRRLYSA